MAKVDTTWQKNVKPIFGQEKQMQVTVKELPSHGNSHNPDPKVRSHVEEKMVKHIFSALEKYPEIEGAPTPKKVTIQFTDSPNQTTNNSAQEQIQEQKIPGEIDASLLIKDPRNSLEKIIIPPTTKKRIQEILNLCQKIGLIKSWGYDDVSGMIILEGLPGTGKTSIAHGIAKALGKKILEANNGQFSSRYVGQTENNICRIFAEAEKQDAVVFLDEVDTAAGKRLSNPEDTAARGINSSVNTLLAEIEKFSGLVIVATNNAQVLDAAFVDRGLDAISISLPDVQCRQRIFEVHISKKHPLAPDISLAKLADFTEGFSGREIKKVVKKVVLKTASRNYENEQNISTMNDFLEAIEQVRHTKNIISNSQDSQTKNWMLSQAMEITNGQNNDNHKS
ncbi:MAG: ATP-binding protein [Okeania sp. SIO3B5]|uniref:ATP-binding protein n=1 Tax=Okeania sp. SIO3B5 TaxID=2607811 RepID=UPI0014015C4D|nr:ATP-binding protein [Okeania sp. SIO3B5]NEO51857.1 ATP-binding protein [Okeania sp. SIO3B5]